MSFNVTESEQRLLGPEHLVVSTSSFFSAGSFSPAVPVSTAPMTASYKVSSSLEGGASEKGFSSYAGGRHFVTLGFVSSSPGGSVISSCEQPLTYATVLGVELFAVLQFAVCCFR